MRKQFLCRQFTRVGISFTLANPSVTFTIRQSIDVNDVEQKTASYSTIKTMSILTTQNTLAFKELTQTYPVITFYHVYPGFVNTGQLDRFMLTATGVWKYPAILAR